VTDIPETARRLAGAFWPGPLTLIMPAGPRVPQLVTSGLPNVAIRMPSHPVAQALIKKAGVPIAAPSANRFMHISPTTAQHVYADLNGRVSLILDGGPSAVGVESTVLDLSSEIPRILRPGGVSLEALRLIIPQVQPPQDRPTHGQEYEAQQAPGQMLTHYSPTIPTFLVDGSSEEIRTILLAEIKQRRQQGQRIGLLIGDESEREIFQAPGVEIYALGATMEQIATRLYAGLRTLEETGVDVILCHSFTRQGIGLAVQDRLVKAAGGKIIRSGA
jgi:L-threonylcarbamoyladenylate synthase